jgi:hypothetical protein
MNPRSLTAVALLTICVGCSVKLPRPESVPGRTLDPQMITAEPAEAASDAVPIRLLDTQARPHIRHHILHRDASGELTEVAVWSWSSPPDRYLDTALHMAAESNTKFRIVDTSDAPTVAVTLIAFHLESTPDGTGKRLVAVAELRVIDREHRVKTQIVEAEAAVDSELPGNLAVAAGNVLHRIATNCFASVGKLS